MKLKTISENHASKDNDKKNDNSLNKSLKKINQLNGIDTSSENDSIKKKYDEDSFSDNIDEESNIENMTESTGDNLNTDLNDLFTDKQALNKHEFGHLYSQFKSVLIKTSVQFGVAIILLIIGFIIYKTKKNIFTLIAVLGLLPAGQTLVNLIMLIRAKKYSCSIEIKNNINNVIINDNPIIGYDYYITSYDVQFPVQSITVIEDSIIGYTTLQNFDHKAFEKHIKNMLSKNGYKISVIKIFNENELDKYINRIDGYSNNSNKQKKKELMILALMGSLSL